VKEPPILSTTKTGAEICGQEKRLGTIEPGKIANIIIVEGNPLNDLDDLRKIKAVIKNGNLFCSDSQSYIFAFQ
jgi:imidazolonepropionase-like amidohydrolase